MIVYHFSSLLFVFSFKFSSDMCFHLNFYLLLFGIRAVKQQTTIVKVKWRKNSQHENHNKQRKNGKKVDKQAMKDHRTVCWMIFTMSIQYVRIKLAFLLLCRIYYYMYVSFVYMNVYSAEQ